MKKLSFSFVLGAVVGAFAALVVGGPLDDEDEPSVAENTQITPNVTPIRGPQDVVISPESTDIDLAIQLDRSRFDRDWDRVTGVSRALRARGSGQAASPSIPFGGGSQERRASMILLDHGYRRRAFLLEIEGHDNEATRLAKGDASTADRERRLRNLLLAPQVSPAGALVRSDAAFLLGFMKTDGARIALVRLLKDPDALLADLAAEALARSGDPAAVRELTDVLAGDLDASQRARAAAALVWTQSAASGGDVALAIVRAAREDRDPSVRTHALASLARVDLQACDVGRELLSNLAEDETAEASVRLAAVAAMRAHRRIARDLPLDLVISLERALEKSSGHLRIEVVRALGEAGRSESLTLLEGEAMAASDPEEIQALRDAIASLERRSAPR